MPTTSRGAPYPVTSAQNNVPGDLQALAAWVNDRPGLAVLTTAQRNALTGGELWEGRHIYNTTTDRLEYFDGDSWEQIPMPGRILGSKLYAPSPSVGLTTASTTLVDVDAANLAVTFIAPASGAVFVELEGLLALGGVTAPTGAYWGLRDGSTSVAGPTLLWQTLSGVTTRERAVFSKAGLTPGGSYTYKWAHQVLPSGGSPTTGLQVSVGSFALMRVVEAA